MSRNPGQVGLASGVHGTSATTMQIAVLTAIHANADALSAVLADARGAGAHLVLSLGDNVGYHPKVRQTIALLQREGIPSVYGDRELVVGGLIEAGDAGPEATAVVRARALLSATERRYLARLPSGLHFDRATLFLHGRWGDPVRSIETDADFVAQREVVMRWDRRVSVCFTGHADQPVVVEVDRRGEVHRSDLVGSVQLGSESFYFVTPGRVGCSATPSAAAYILYDTKSRRVEARRVAYDVEVVARRMGRGQLARAS